MTRTENIEAGDGEKGQVNMDKITFSKIKKTGAWGVLVESDSSLDLAGEVVEVAKKNGGTGRVKLGSQVWSKRNGAVTVAQYAIADKHPKRVLTSELGAVGAAISRDDAEYARGVNDTRAAQAMGPAGSAGREAAYLMMEQQWAREGFDG